MATRVVKKKEPTTAFNLEAAVREFRNDKFMAAEIAKRMLKHKDVLKKYVDDNGYEDEKGNRWFDLDDGTKLKHERRVTTSLDEDKTETYLRYKGLWEDCIETIEAISEEKILRFNYDGEITDADLAGLYVERESWAFVAG